MFDSVKISIQFYEHVVYGLGKVHNYYNMSDKKLYMIT